MVQEIDQEIEQVVSRYAAHLRREEKAQATVEKYTRYAAVFLGFVGEHGSFGENGITREGVVAFKEKITRGYTAAGANGVIAAVNSFLSFMERPELRVKALKVQRAHFSSSEKCMTRRDLDKLVAKAEELGKERLAMVIRTIFATGIRVGELGFITVEAARGAAAGNGVEIRLKGKIRTILLPDKLCAMLLEYAGKRGITGGRIFVTRGGKPWDRSNIWLEMKRLCRAAKVAPKKVYPHNLRKLFARTYYERRSNLVELAGLMGHSDINTTRLYTQASRAECIRHLNALRLIS